jgi:catechol 2,3-dioxygenase
VGRVRLRVADLERALGFYRDVLGLAVTRVDGTTAALAAGHDATIAAGRELIVLVEHPGIARRPRRPVSTGLYHFALLVPNRAELGRALLGLEAARYPMRGTSDHAVSESIYLDDPDGNGLEIYADRPRAAWRWADGEVYMTVEPIDLDGVIAAARERAASARWAGLPSGTVVGHVHFTVSNLERSVAFYRDVLGFGVTARLPGLVGVAAGGYHHHVNLNAWAGPDPAPDSERVAGLEAWELVVADPDARRALAGRITAAGALAPAGGPDAPAWIGAADPDGIGVEVAGG